MTTCQLCDKQFKPTGNKKITRCGYCTVRLRRTRIKLAAVKYKGGKCIRCTWYGPIEGFHFHHRDPSCKEFSISDRGTMYKWSRVKIELDKCDLLCAICHSLEHSNRSEEYNAAVLDYRNCGLDIDLPSEYLDLRV